MTERQLTILQAATELGVQRETILYWCRKGYIEFTRRPSGHRRFADSEVQRMKREHRYGHWHRVVVQP